MTSFQGYIPTDAKQLQVVERLMVSAQGSLEFCDVAPHLKDHGAGKLSLPYMSVRKFDPEAFEDEAQDTGDCTSHATRNAAQIAMAAEVDILKEPERYVGRLSTECIYGHRGHGGQGMNPGRATEFVTKYGLVPRARYSFADLSRYDSRIGSNWGRRGVPQEAKTEAAKHPCQYFLRIRNVEEARDALASGYGIHCGSNYGNNGVRDSKGMSRWNDSWNHDMSWGGCDDGTMFDDLVFIILNSWGRWNRGGHPPWGKLPGGAFIVPSKDARRMIQSGECWAVGQVDGWPLRDLPDYGTGSFL